ncbi:MAG: ribosomal protein [Patescibacteria group bacterium]|nr:ribosomal protein [Patescibacteria group bacterium]
MQNTPVNGKNPIADMVRDLFKLGAHFGYSRVRRHPSADRFIFGYKNKTAIIDLEKTIDSLNKAKDFVRTLGSEGKEILLVGNKNEARAAIKKIAEAAGLPYSAERWIGGTLTNSKQIKTRIKRLEDIKAAELSGDIMKYTKKERGLIAKEKKDLERFFGGVVSMHKMPGAMFVVDSEAEGIAVAEANKMNIPVIALANSDCDIRGIMYPIVGNDGSAATIAFITEDIVKAYDEGRKSPAGKPVETKVENKEAE